MVVPTPTATPPTAATSGVSQRASACRKSKVGPPSSPPCCAAAMKAPMSLPAVKPLSLPAMTMQRRPSRFSLSAALSASYIGGVSAFFFSGRFTRTVRTGPSSVTRIRDMEVLPGKRKRNRVALVRRACHCGSRSISPGA
jgi:hypothetical protein